MNCESEGNKNLWQYADHFRAWVCAELGNLTSFERLSLRGDYLFSVDGSPRFIVMVDEAGAYSVTVGQGSASATDTAWQLTPAQVLNVIEGSARTHILTDSLTLSKLLQGTLKARIAFITSKVTITGDLPAFLKMASLLKKRGIRSGVQIK